ncbi:olfactory receptor 51G2-like isoform X2 [Pleurodeles waltl]|uniref:olfactory receptor 51G2-like isoform X2 n=1 Tax=Pleurodeles waltl TaxID=8319 RepID=UPI0037099C55
MAAFFSSSFPSFLLMGFFETEVTQLWISIPLCFLYLLSVLGNGLIMFIVKTESHLSEPMYLFLSMLSATDVGLTLSTLPTVLSVFFFDIRNINFFGCLTQLFLIHSLSSTGSALLVAMAFDRYVAVCNPLRYASILHPMISKIGLVALARGACIHFPLPFLLKRLPYCGNNKLYHAFCFHPDVMKLACADTTINSTYGLVLVLCTFLLDSLFILTSYLLILKTALKVTSKGECLKAFSTCVSHICVVLTFYIPLIGLTLAHRYGKDASPVLHVAMGLAYLCVPPALNPIIYSMKTRKIKTAIWKYMSTDTRWKHHANSSDARTKSISTVHSQAFGNEH